MMKKEIVFIINSIDNQRCRKRVKEFSDNGFSVDVYGFDRGLGTVEWSDCTILSSYSNQVPYKKRVKIIISALRKLFNEKKNSNVIWYYFGFDIAMFSLFLNMKSDYIYEESDLVHMYIKNPILKKVFERIDKFIIRKSKLSVFTSEGFAEFHYSDKKWPSNILIKPNKINPIIQNIPIVKKKPIDPNQLVFGFVGMIRYESVKIMADVISKNFPNHKFYFWGVINAGSSEKNREFENLRERPNVFFGGRYKNPDDLPKIYSQIDVVVSTYDTTEVNVLFAEPNKLYESIYFRTPIIVSSGTFLEKQVKKYGVGYSVNAYQEQDIISLVREIEKGLLKIQQQIDTINPLEALDSCTELISRIKNII